MPAITSTTTLTLPAGQAFVFEAGSGVAIATADPGGRNARYSLGPQRAIVGPWTQAVSVLVEVASGTLVYSVDVTGADLGDQDPSLVAINEALGRLGTSSYAKSAVPVVLVPSGSFADTVGNFTLGTALSAVPNGATPLGGNAYVSLPAGAGGLAGGLYEAAFSSASAGQVLGVVTTAASWTQSTGIVTLASIPISGGSIGKHGSLDLEINTSNNNSAGNKTIRCGLNATTGVISVATTTTTGTRSRIRVQNRGAENKQFASTGSGSFGVMAAGTTWSVDTSAAWAINVTAQIAVATDWVILDAFTVSIVRGD